MLDPYNGKPVDPNFALPFTLDPKFKNTEAYSLPIDLDPKLKSKEDYTLPFDLDPKLKNTSNFSLPFNLDPKLKNTEQYSLPFSLDPKLKPVPTTSQPSNKADKSKDLTAFDLIRSVGSAADLGGLPGPKPPPTAEEIEAKRIIAEEKARLQAEAEKKAADEKARIQEEAERKAAAEEEVRLKAETEKKAVEEEENRLKAEASKKAAEEEEIVRKAEADIKQARIKAEEEEQAEKEAKALQKVIDKFSVLQSEAETYKDEIARQRRPSKTVLHRRASARIVDDDEDDHDHHYDFTIQEEEHEIIDVEPHHEEFDALEQAYNADVDVIDEDDSEFLSVIEDEDDLAPVPRDDYEPKETPLESNSSPLCSIPIVGSVINVFNFAK